MTGEPIGHLDVVAPVELQGTEVGAREVPALVDEVPALAALAAGNLAPTPQPADGVTYADPPMKFEAGTPGIVQQIGLGVADRDRTVAGSAVEALGEQRRHHPAPHRRLEDARPNEVRSSPDRNRDVATLVSRQQIMIKTVNEQTGAIYGVTDINPKLFADRG